VRSPRRLPALVLALAAAPQLAGCSDEPSAEERRADLVEELAADLVAETDGALDDEAARCVAERLADDVGVDRFDEVIAAADDEDGTGLRDQVIDAFSACDALDPLLADG